MAEFSLPPGAFAAAKTGAPQPSTQPAPKQEQAPKTVTRKAEPPKPEASAEPDVTKKEENVDKPSSIERKIWKLKDGDQEYEFDATDDEAVKREIMKARGADKRFKESASMRQQAETFFQMLKDPAQLKKVLTDPRVGIDLKKFAEDFVWEGIQESQMSEDQKKDRDDKRELEALRQKDVREKQAKEDGEKAQRQIAHEEHYEKNILKALEMKGVPKDQMTVMKMADYMIAAVQKGYDLSPEEIADLVKNDTAAYLKAYASALNEDQFLEFLGEHAAEKLRKADLKRLRSPTGNPFPEKYPRKSESAPPGAKKMSSSDWRKQTMDGFLARK